MLFPNGMLSKNNKTIKQYTYYIYINKMKNTTGKIPFLHDAKKNIRFRNTF